MSVSYELLLHPELLTNEQLLYIIQERHLRIPNIERMKRDEILVIFHHYCVPHGQRKYRESGRGRVLNRARPTSPEPPSKLHTMAGQWTNNKNTNPHCNRLKPPPDLLTGHMKRIKIENTATPMKTQTNVNNVKRKMSIDAIAPATDSPPPKKEKKPITWPCHMKRIKIENTATPMKTQTNVNNVKRKMSIDAIAPATDSPPPKKEKKPITWP